MRVVVALAAGTFWLAMSGLAVAQDFTLKVDLFGQKIPAPKPPKVNWNWRPPATLAQTAKPTVICGMIVVPADPKSDPRIRRAPSDTGVRFAMKVVEPTVCTPPQR
jgi:hypothetical protein